MATNQKAFAPVAIGVMPALFQGDTTTVINAAGTWIAFSFYQHTAQTLNAVRIWMDLKAGTLGAHDLTCDIYSDSAGSPSVSLASSNTLSSPAATQIFNDFTGFNLALSAGTQYWIVLKNVNGTPASNNMRYRWNKGTNQVVAVAGMGNSVSNGSRAQATVVKTTTNSGTTWSLNAAGVVNWRLAYSDGSYAGFMHGGQTSIAGIFGTTAGIIFGARESGVLFTTPAAAAWKLRGGALLLGATGSPPGDVLFHLYKGTTLIASTETLSHTLLVPAGGSAFVYLYFSTDQILQPNTAYRLTAAVTSGGDSSNYYNPVGYYVDSDSNSTALLPFASPANPTGYPLGTWFDGTVWAQPANYLPAFALILDTDGEFAPPWPRRPAGMMGGFNG